MDLKHLRYFVAVAEELHFTRAAARLHISQPPLSQIINRLEDSLGFRLLERTKRKVTLTEAGKVLLPRRVRAILARTEFAVQHARRAARGDIGHLKVAFVPWADFTTAFSDLFRTYGEKYPNVTVDFHSMSAPAARVALSEDRIDVAFLTISASSEPPRGFNHEVVLSNSIKVALPEGHPLARKRIVPIREELAIEPQIVAAHDRHGSLISHLLLERAGLSMHARHVIDHPQTTLALVAAGAGVSLVPASCENVSRPGVVYRPIKPTEKVRLIAAWKPDGRAPALRAFLDTLREVTTTRTVLEGRATGKRMKRAAAR